MSAHSAIALVPEACTSCLLCVRECPAWCIELQAHAEEVTEPGARRPRTVNVLDAFSIDYGLCLFCGICIEVCPLDALHWQTEPHVVARSRSQLVDGIDELRSPGGSRSD